jgi:undecaprenyl diphosphate synthase
MPPQTQTQVQALKTSIQAAGNLPRHIAVIMDGNGRWARRRVMPRIAGHRAGRHAVRETVRSCAELGIEFLSLYTFSVENWKRPSYEVRALWAFLEEVLRTEFLELKDNNIRLIATGDLPRIPDATRRALEDAQARLSQNTGMVLNLCLSYGGRQELVRAAQRFAEDVAAGRRKPRDLNENLLSTYLFAPDLPDPDLLIRTSGELRLSNFLLWQLAYAELYVTDVYWPDFDKQELYKAIAAYQARERRFGGL